MKRLDGVCVTEHGPPWQRAEVERLYEEHGILILRGMEVATDLGHIVVFGLPGYTSGILKAEGLRRATDEVGGFMIAVHPFRGVFDPVQLKLRAQRPLTVEEVMRQTIFSLVDEIEVANGGCTERENLLALRVAKRLGMIGTAGSDAHSTHGLGCFVTIFEREIRSEEDLIRELREGRFYPARRLHSGEIIPFEEELV